MVALASDNFVKITIHKVRVNKYDPEKKKNVTRYEHRKIV